MFSWLTTSSLDMLFTGSGEAFNVRMRISTGSFSVHRSDEYP